MATMRDKLISYDFLPINGALFDEEPDFDVEDASIDPRWAESADLTMPIQFCYSE